MLLLGLLLQSLDLLLSFEFVLHGSRSLLLSNYGILLGRIVKLDLHLVHFGCGSLEWS